MEKNKINKNLRPSKTMINLNLTNSVSVHNNIITINQDEQFFTIVCADKEDVDENLKIISDYQKMQTLLSQEDDLEDIANIYEKELK